MRPTDSSNETLARARCKHCESYVSHKFLRVFGDNDNEVHACLNCTSMRELVQGAAVPD